MAKPAATSPRSSFSGSVTSLPPASRAASTSSDRRQVAVLDLGQLAGAARARRGSRRSPRTAAGPRTGRRRCANTGSSCLCDGQMSFSPGMSSAVSTATTPGAASHRVEIDRDDLGMRRVAEPEIGVERALRLDHVVDIVGAARDVLVRAVVRRWPRACRPRARTSSLFMPAPSGGQALPRPVVSRKNRRRRFLRGQQPVLGRGAHVGDAAGSPSRTRRSRPRSSPCVHGLPISAASTAAARFGVAAMPPKAMRTLLDGAAVELQRGRRRRARRCPRRGAW